MSITQTKSRIGNYTSSQIYRLMGSKRVKETYKEEKELERKIKMAIKEDVGSRSSNWGTIMEYYVNENYLPIGWNAWTSGTIESKEFENWSGTPDIYSEDAIGDIKCYGRKKFAQMASVIALNDLEIFKKQFPDTYWQLTSNAALADKNKCMVLIYLPYEKELDDIANWVANYEIDHPWKYRFISESESWELPCQSNDSDFDNVITFEWYLVKEDVEALKNELE